jgi:hypothetical protein
MTIAEREPSSKNRLEFFLVAATVRGRGGRHVLEVQKTTTKNTKGRDDLLSSHDSGCSSVAGTRIAGDNVLRRFVAVC